MPIKTLLPQREREQVDFDAIRLKVASPETVYDWSHGEVTKPETINYRTQKPEKDGLFDERIFGPTKDFECYCGKYKRIRYKGIVCEKCGVEVTRSIVRRERMGHIQLAAPVTHIWFLRGVPSKIGLLLDLSVQDLEKVIYFANYIITEINEELRQQALEQVKAEFKQKKKQIESEFDQKINNVRSNQTLEQAKKDEQISALEDTKVSEVESLTEAKDVAYKELSDLKLRQIISESAYMDLSLKYGQVFEAGIGAEAIRMLLEQIDLEPYSSELQTLADEASKSQVKRLNKRLKLSKNLIKNNIQPEWMVLTALPVIPPDLRPMVALDGGRYAASDLNDLYRRVINRNNRLKRLLELNAPEVIVRNEKRMLQEAVDALIDNGARHGKTVTASTGQKRQLKSLADALKGKQGRFRQNLLGKRTDYSGRSVIVVGPHLRLGECGLPKHMALELFRPFVIAQLIQREVVHNVRSANRFIDTGADEVWDILEEIIVGAHVLLNRAPTLHRLGIQAFKPVLIEGKAIKVHPMVCPAFNADFDGDQMAVHVPLTKESRAEAAEIMLSAKNLLKPGDGRPIVKPDKDMIWGVYYLSYTPGVKEPEDVSSLPAFATANEAVIAYQNSAIGLQAWIRVLVDEELVVTTPGRLILNTVIPEEIGFINEVMNSGLVGELVAEVIVKCGDERAARFLDELKELSLEYITLSGLSWGMADLPEVAGKEEVLLDAEQKVSEIRDQFEEGLLTNDERHTRVIEIWTEAKDRVVELAQQVFSEDSAVHTIIDSKARGSWAQMSQMMGMKGNVTNPAGDLIELPVKASFKEGMDVLEYFISTHGARKGLSDTALRTANAGYLTRRLVDVAQDNVITLIDCEDTEGFELTKRDSQDMSLTLPKRVVGRVAAKDVLDPKSGKAIISAGELMEEEHAQKVEDAGVESVTIRSIMTCRAQRGVCQKCYGWDLGHNSEVRLGTAAGIIAAQSIGEPGTQLTMRTFHTGGVGGADITQGLPRVEEIFEARPVKKSALISPIDGQVTVEDVAGTRQKVVTIKGFDRAEQVLVITQEELDHITVKDGEKIKKNQELLERTDGPLLAPVSGTLAVDEPDGSGAVTLRIYTDKEVEKELIVPAGMSIWLKTGDLVAKGDVLSEGSADLQELYHLKGLDAVRKYILKEILYIYISQGQRLNEKHVEIIIKQMFSRVMVVDSGDTDFLGGEVTEYTIILAANEEALANGGRPATFNRLLLGITKVSLSTESWLSAASFQETARVLIDAAVTGKVDNLRGLKENVIIGRRIPAGTGFVDDGAASK